MKIILLSLLLSVSALFSRTGADVLWLSQIPPQERAMQIKPAGMHRLPSIKQRGRGPVVLAMWLRQGESVLEASYPDQFGFDSLDILVLSPGEERISYDLVDVDGGLELQLKGLGEGFYNTYLLGKTIENKTLKISTIQSELMNHSCRNGHEHVSRNLGPYYGGENIPLEIVRTRLQWEDYHTFITSGDVIEYQLLKYGQPAPDVKVTLSTHQGWQKSKFTDAEGLVSFEFIGEYFGKDKEFHSRDIYHYLLVAEQTVQDSGVFQNQAYQTVKYQTTVSEKYRPATEIYTSTVWGLVTMLVTMVVISLGVFVYRRKTSHDYREIVFSEKD